MGGPPPSEQIARYEARQLRRIGRLCARLKDPFPPFVLRSDYRAGTSAVHDWVSVLGELEEIETADPTLFKDVAISAARHAQRTYIRYCPYIVLAPVCGEMGYAWNPRDGTEVGRLVLPAYSPASGGFCGGCCGAWAPIFAGTPASKAPGRDLLTSDTLVAEYSAVRWDYRHRPRDVRQRAAIHSEESDRKNWRRHYSLYLTSAREAGRQLFFKCPAVYDVAVKYVPLPEGVERLRR